MPSPVLTMSSGLAPGPSAHQILKTATAEAHASVDRLVSIDSAWTIDRYRGLLRALHAVLAPMTPALRACLGPDRFPLVITAASRLEADLDAVGSRVSPPSTRVPPIDDEAAAWGAAYVWLGSHLGGPFIARAVRDPLCLRPEHLTYLTPDTPVAPEWRRFLADLEVWHAGADASARHCCTGTALAIFAAVESALMSEGLQ
ncbi:MAG TPA: biliverdin-producing heme oxygenase [Luteitalea sp.]|nr:biliverdin-producing heme oxygenase [Luteitalea sp.]